MNYQYKKKPTVEYFNRVEMKIQEVGLNNKVAL
jgi:hypothetical protein